jgi:hypothetical protein
MNAAREQYNTDHALQSTSDSFNLTYLIRQINFSRDLSDGAKVVGIQMLIAAGRKGYIRDLTMRQLGWETDNKRTQLHTYVDELIRSGWLERQEHPGRPNVWIIPEVRNIFLAKQTRPVERTPRYKSKNQENGTVETVISICPEETHSSNITGLQTPSANADNQTAKIEAPSVQEDAHASDSEDLPPRKPIRMDVVSGLIEATGDRHSFGLWVKIAKNVDIPTIRYCLSCLRVAQADGTVRHPGKYLTKLFKTYGPPDLFEKHALRPSQHNQDAPTYTKPPESEPEVEPDFDLNMSMLKQIQSILDKKMILKGD